MILTSVKIESFRTIVSPQEVTIDPKVTVLMGANESGKTNLLQAMHCMSRRIDLTFDDISKCRRDRYARRILPVVSFKFLLSETDKKNVNKISNELSSVDTFVVHKNGNRLQDYSLTIPPREHGG